MVSASAFLVLVKIPAVYGNVTNDWDANCRIAFLATFFMEELAPEINSMMKLCARARNVFFDDGSIDADGSGNRLMQVIEVPFFIQLYQIKFDFSNGIQSCNFVFI